MESRRRLGVSAELVWLVPKPTGEGVAVVYLEALDPERALGELAASEVPFDSWYSGAMRKRFGFDLARLPRAAGESFCSPGAMIVVRASVRLRKLMT